jgi:TRAP-type C4-dicarboxylate transport system permease small subunit
MVELLKVTTMKISKGDRILIAFGLVVVCAMFLIYTLIYAWNPWMKPIISFSWLDMIIIYTITILSISSVLTFHVVRWYLRKIKNTMKEAIKEGIKEGLKESEEIENE